MAMAITMFMVARFCFATEVTQGRLLSAHYTHIKRPPNSRCVLPSGLEDTTKMTTHSRPTGLPDLAGDLSVFRIVTLACRVYVIYNISTYMQHRQHGREVEGGERGTKHTLPI
jgi:hypothetical protein